MKNKASLLQKIISAVSRHYTIKVQNTAVAQKSLEQIFSAIHTLSQKADGRLAEKYPDISLCIKKIAQETASFSPDVSTNAGKTEQEISQKITCVSSSCDTLLSGGTSNAMAEQLSDLEKLVQLRLRLS